MKNLTTALRCNPQSLLALCVTVCMLVVAAIGNVTAQCVPVPNAITGTVFVDGDNDGELAALEVGQSNVNVTAYLPDGSLAGAAVTDTDGSFTIADVTEGIQYQLVFAHTSSLVDAVQGPDNGSSVQYVAAPACDVNYGLTDVSASCGAASQVVLSCFVNGEVDVNPTAETLVGLPANFTTTTAVTKYATQAETGTVWGVAVKTQTQEVFSSAFVKFNAGLKDGPYALFKTDASTVPATTSLFADVNALTGGGLSGLGTNSDVTDCAFGANVGRVGLGNMIITPNESMLYVSVLDNNTIVGVSTTDPSAATTTQYKVPRPAGLAVDREFRLFALAWHQGMLYVGVTVTAAESKRAADSRFVVMTLDPGTGVFEEVFETDVVRGFWQDDLPSAYIHSHWLTDIAFADEGYMMLGITDRLGHVYCRPQSNHRLDQQYPDLLGVYIDEITGKWTLEQGGFIAGVAGSGVGNGDGPNGQGEFFGDEFWPTNPEYHNETALGSIFVVPGSGEVLVAVYDPFIDSYSGGVHRYSTADGSLAGVKQLYRRNSDIQFGKATGFGDIAALCSPTSIELGNFAWVDTNGDGQQNAGEPLAAGLDLNLYNEQCVLIASTSTDANGNYVFNDDNVVAGIAPNTTYYIEIDNGQLNEATGLYVIGDQEYTLCTRDAQVKADRDCDVLAADDDTCFEGAYIEVNTTSTNHTFDIGLGVPGGFDLALMKSIVGDKFAKNGELMTFKVEVYNQGGQTASEVEVIDYIPTGYVFEEAENLGWTMEDGKLHTIFEDELLPNTSVSKLLRLRVVANHDADYINVAEISESLDFSGESAVDIDSNADENNSNDMGGVPGTSTDDSLDGTGLDDEDDSDPALPCVFDLALRVELADERDYLAGETVKFDVTVFNQGNVAADQYNIVHYVAEGLAFDEELSTEWLLVDGVPTIDTKDNLEPGANRTFCIYFTVGTEIGTGAISSFAEISESTPVGSTASFDIDSTPDAINDNDNGAEAYTVTDNFLAGNSVVDEDDHDIVVVTSRYVDLALRKSVEKDRASKGDYVVFTLEIHNQGTQPVDKVRLADYLPEGMILADDNWVMLDDSKAERILSLDIPLQQGHFVETEIRTQILADAVGYSFVNLAEISGIYHGDRDLSAYDVDSTPDMDKDNDAGGRVGTEYDDMITLSKLIDEDDHDPAMVVVVDSRLVSSVCLANATPTEDGTYLDLFEITGPEGDAWYADFVLNYLDAAGEVPVTTGPGGLVFVETPLGDGRAAYTVSLQRPEGQVARIDFRNDSDDIQSFETDPESYSAIVAEGTTAICGGGTYTYTVTNPVAGVTYTWSLPGEGAFVGASEGTSVEVNWDGAAAPAYHQLIAEADGCYSPGIITVANGVSSGAMFCLGHINLSLDYDCEITVNPNILLSGGMPAGTAYSVMLLNEHNEVIPNATLNASHIGMTVTAKVVDGCSGNSCWTTILVEDKLNPTIICEGSDLFCNRIDSYAGPVAEDNCGGNVTISLLSDAYTPYTDCNEEFLGEYNRTYQATDEQGNVSEICPVTVRVRRVDLADVAYPIDTTVNCGGFLEDENGFPAPAVTGVPVYNNEEIFPQLDINAPCLIVTTYTDTRLPAVGSLGGVVKVMRTWTVYEWCSTPSFRTHTQVIKIRDTTPPVITNCPDPMTVSAATGQCEATFVLPLPEAMDECSNFSITTMYPGGSILGDASRIISLPASNTPYTITYIVIDDAGFETSCTSEVTVIDNIAPTVFCDGNTTVSLNNNGVAYMYAGVIDDGSYDACGIDSFAVQRMDAQGQCGYDNTTPADRVFFCCEDVGQINMVQLTVWDVNGNSNSCMVNVDVQDKKAPLITTLPNQQIECSDELYPLSQFGTPEFTDACNVTLAIDSIVNVNSCGTGTVTRVFTASDSNGSSTSTQIITIVNSDPFSADDITFLPGDLDFVTSAGNCSLDNLHPDSLENGRPLFTTDACDLVGAAFEDDVYEIEDACFKIVRTWTITDWCQEEDPTYEELTHVQIIKVTNEVAPTIQTSGPFTADTDDCDGGFIALSASATDDCSVAGDLRWTAFVYFDQVGVDTQTPDATYTGVGAVAMADGTYPVGTHFVQWVFTDGCDNITSVLEEFTIVNTIAPELACVDLSVGLGPMDLDMDGVLDTEMACFFVDTMLSLTGGSIFHPCGTEFELSLSADQIVKKDTFDCSDLGINTITIYAIDIFGNTTSCVIDIDVQDNNDVDICLDVKDCTDIPTTGDLEVGANCLAVITTTDFDPSQISTECGELIFTHSLPGTPSTTTLVGAELPVGTTIVTWTITNGAMTDTCDVVIEVTDEIDPVITCAINTTFTDDQDGVNDCQHTASGLDPTATDNCGIVSLTHDYGTGDDTTLDGAIFPIGSTDVTWTAVDESGNEASCTITVVVTDTTDPELLCGSIFNFDDTDDLAEDCGHTVTGSGLDPTATDNCTMAVSLTHDYPSGDDTTLDGATFPVGSTDVVWTATDGAGNSIDCTITIVVADNVDPEIMCAASIAIPEEEDNIIDCQYRVGDTSLDATGTDNCTTVTITHDYTSAPSTTTLEDAVFPVGETEVTWTVTDASGNTTTCLRIVTVTDNTGPMCVEQDTVYVAIGMAGEYVLTTDDLSTLLQDACDGTELTYSFDPSALDCDNVGDTLSVTFSATDSENNVSADCPLVVVVMEAGMLECNPIDITVELDETGTVTIAPDDVNNVGMSACGIDPDVTIDPSTFGCDNVGDNTVTITVTNGADEVTCTAIVTVEDNMDPEIICQENMTIPEESDGLTDCQFIVEDNSLDATGTDNCGTVTTIHDYADAPSMTTLEDAIFPVGMTEVTWTVTDANGNTSTCLRTITVTDNTGPMCVEQDTVSVTIDMTGEYVLSTDDLSTLLEDACDGTNLTYSFNPSALNCDNVGDTLTIGFSAEDGEGNMSPGCGLVVIVNEAGMPECNPIDITVDLGESGSVTINPDDVNNSGVSACGIEPDVTIDPAMFSCNDVGENTVTITVTNGTDTLTCTAIVTITDTIAGPELQCGGDQNITCTELEDMFGGDIDAWMDATVGIVTIFDNCPMNPDNPYDTTELRIYTDNVCGVGVSTRTFTVTDGVGLSDQCVQIFTVTSEDPLTQADIDALALPDTVTVLECIDIELILPNNTDVGQITTDSIAGVASCFRDSIFFTDTSLSGGAACEDTITRVWTVIDSCQLDVTDPSAGIFELTQIIIINDNTAPLVTGVLDIEAIVDPVTCVAFIGFDDLAATDCNSFTASNNGAFAINPDSLSPAGEYPVGDYEIVITTTDVCGNTGLDTINVSVQDTTPLSVTCIKLFIPIEDDVTLTITVNPEDYVIVEGNCDSEEVLQFSYSLDDLNDTIRVWGCAEVDSMIEGRVYWFDEDGVFIDSCRIETTPQDPDSLCVGMGRVVLAGNILNPAGVGIPSFYVNLEGSGLGISSDDSGTYVFPEMGAGGEYAVAPVKDGDDIWGVNTLDLIQIQRHLLGISPFDSPYKLIAADITNDEKVTPADLLALRKLLLGVNTSFANNTSWRAIDAAYTFPDAQDPWAAVFPEKYEIDDLASDMFVGFVGVKVGDVNESGTFVSGKIKQTRNESATTYQYHTVESDSDVTLVSVLATDTELTYGAQFDLTLEATSLVGVSSDYFASANIAYHEVEDGLYRVIVTAPEGVEIAAGEQVLELQVITDQSWAVADQLTFGTEAVAYLGADLEETGIDFSLQVTEEQEAEQRTFAVMQNRPNPWSANTVVSFQIPAVGKVSVTVFDINGRVVYTKSATYEAGVHNLELGTEDLPQSGIYYYHVNYGTETSQHKMIKID